MPHAPLSVGPGRADVKSQPSASGREPARGERGRDNARVPDPRIVTLAAPGGDLEARFAAGAAMVGCSLRHRGEELLGLRGGLEDYLARGKTFGIPLLHPWANRLGAWEYEVAGREVRLDRDSGVVRADEHGLPIHGAMPAGAAWRLTETTAASLRAQLDWAADPRRLAIFPFPHVLELRAALAGDALRVETSIAATGDAPVPLAFGFHPYLAPPGAPREEWEVELPAMSHLALDDRGLPTGAREPWPAERFALDGREFDDAFAVGALPVAFAVSDGTRRIAVELEHGFPYAQVFAPPGQPLICFEPMTAPTDALRTHDGLRCVAPGERASATFAVRVQAG
jgi:aldose 1-epimerase